MANRFIDVTLRLIDRATTPLSNIGAKLTESSRQWIRAGNQIQKTGQKISRIGSSLTKSVTTPIVSMGVVAVKNFGEVDKSMRLVRSTMGETKWETEDLAKAIKKSAANSVFSMQDATNATLNFARQGFNAKQSAKMLTPALDLAAGTATDLSTVSSGLGNTLKVFSSQGLTASKTADVLAKAQAQANTTTTELFNAMSVGSSTFKTVGWSMQDLAAITGVFGDNFISGSEGATAMKTGLARLLSPSSKESANWMKKLNLNLVNSNGTMKSMTNVQGQLHKSFSKLTQEQKVQAASAIFGKNQMNKWLTLIGTAPKTVKKYRNALDDTKGTANKMGNALMSGVGGSIEKMKSTFDVFKYSVGETTAKPVKKIIDKITDLMEKFNKLDETQQKNIVKFALLAAAVGPAVLVFGKMVSTVGKVTIKIGTLGKMFRTYGTVAGMLTSPSAIAVGAVAAIAVAALLVIKNWSKVKPVLLKVKDWFVTTFEKVKVSMQPFQKICSSVIAQVIKSIKSLKPTFDKMVKTVISNLPKMQKTAQKLFNTIKPILSQVINLIKKIANAVGEVLIYAFKKVTPIVKKFGELFNVVFPLIVSVVQNHINKVIARMNCLKPVVIGVIGFISGVVDTFKKYIKDMIVAITKILGGIIDFITGIFTGNWKKAWDGLKSIVSGIFSGIVATVKRNINLVIDVVNGVIKGLNSIKIPKGIPGIGGKGINIPLIPKLAKGTSNWQGGIVQVHERGGEIIDLPKGSRVYPHDKSVRQAYKDGQAAGGRKTVIQIPKLADTIVVREDADIDKIVDRLAKKLEDTANNVGGGDFEYIY